MKNNVKKFLAVLLAVTVILGVPVSASAEGETDYPEYVTYVLLGDSVASGYNDSEENDTEFVRVDYSYGAIVADALETKYIPMACPGFRTVEMRYMLEDDFEPDSYLFHDAKDGEVMKKRIPEYRKAISEADLITLGIGGNDFGTFLMWVVTDIMEKEGICAAFIDATRELISSGENDIINAVVDLADTMDALPWLLTVLPAAVVYGIVNYVKNWDIMIEDIYALNPDVTLLVIGMFDNAVKTEEDAAKKESLLFNFSIGQAIVDLANWPMELSAEKYGYTFVDTTGTVCDTHHPTNEGHKHIANRILEALPEAESKTGEYDRIDNAGVLKTLIFFVKKSLKF